MINFDNVAKENIKEHNINNWRLLTWNNKFII